METATVPVKKKKEKKKLTFGRVLLFMKDPFIFTIMPLEEAVYAQLMEASPVPSVPWGE